MAANWRLVSFDHRTNMVDRVHCKPTHTYTYIAYIAGFRETQLARWESYWLTINLRYVHSQLTSIRSSIGVRIMHIYNMAATSRLGVISRSIHPRPINTSYSPRVRTVLQLGKLNSMRTTQPAVRMHAK